MRSALVLLLLLLAALAPAGAEAAFTPCGPVGARTLTSGAQSRTYVRRGEAVACTHGARRALHLGTDGSRCYGSSSGCGGIAPTAVAGRFVAAADYSCCGAFGDAFFSLRVHDLRRHRRVMRFDAGRIAVEQASLISVVLRPTGTAAWIMSRDPQPSQAPGSERMIPPPPNFEVRRSSGCGATLLDSGPGVDPDSLRRVGREIRWRRGLITRSAELC